MCLFSTFCVGCGFVCLLFTTWLRRTWCCIFFVMQRLLRIVDGLNFKEFVSFLSTFSPRATLQQKVECNCLFFVVFFCESCFRSEFPFYCWWWLLAISQLFLSFMIRMATVESHSITCWKFCGIWQDTIYLHNRERLGLITKILKECIFW